MTLMPEISPSAKKPVFCLVHGRYHGGGCWKYLQKELRERGYHSIAPTLEIQDRSMSLDDHAASVVDEVTSLGPENVILAGWSWGANVILRKTTEMPVRQLQFVAPSLQAVSYARASMLQEISPPPKEDSRYTLLYDAWKNQEQDVDDRELAQELGVLLFYHDVSSGIRNRYLKSFRSHPRHDGDEPVLEHFPEDIPKVTFKTLHDRVLRQEWLEWQATLLSSSADTLPANGSVEGINTGHSPMLARPGLLAELMTRHAEDTAV